MIQTIRLQNFRSYSDESFEFEPGVNIIVGPNASGKTNLLEAVLVLARGSSYKAKDLELIRFKKPWARLDGFFAGHNRSLKLERAEGAAPTKTFLLDTKTYRRLSLERTVPVVFFEPGHLQLIARGPQARRDYFDELLERTLPSFKQLAGNYRRTLAQRNALLKRGSAIADDHLFAWNVRLSQLGAQIAQARQDLIAGLNTKLAGTYSQIAVKKSQAAVEYKAQFPLEHYASRLLTKLEKSSHQDFERGFTAWGPHREDIIFYLNKQPVAGSASRGEIRSLLLALKILELGLVEAARNQSPIFLLDDVFSELDGARRRALVENLKNYQAILTTTDADAVMEYFAGHHNLIPLV